MAITKAAFTDELWLVCHTTALPSPRPSLFAGAPVVLATLSNFEPRHIAGRSPDQTRPGFRSTALFRRGWRKKKGANPTDAKD
jgi:hypothetical protein